MIIVTGATGTVGSRVVDRLAAAGHAFRAVVRDASSAERRFGSYVPLAVGDLARPETLDAAFDGAERLFLLSPDAPGPEKLELEANVIAAARRAAVERIVYLSVAARETGPEQAFGRLHQETERKIQASGLAWTYLRPVAFMSNLLFSLESIRAESAFYLPAGEGKVSIIAPDDVAAVAVEALVEPGHEGKAYTLTGPQALSHADQAAQLSAAIGREVRYVAIPEVTARGAMNAAGMAPSVVEDLLEFYRLVKAGERASISADFELVMGRRPRTFADFTQKNADEFK